MKLLKKNIAKDGSGSIDIYPEHEGDMWHIYNLVAVGDRVTSISYRKVQKVTSTGSASTTKIRVSLCIAVESVDFDSNSCELRLKGKTVQENKYVKLGAYHTLELERRKNFTLSKESWDYVYIDRLNTACADASSTAELAAVVMQPGLAHVCVVAPHMTITKAKIEANVPRKRTAASSHAKAMHNFYNAVLDRIDKHINFKTVKCLVIASPGFIKDDFHKFMLDTAMKKDMKNILENKHKLLLVHSSSGYKHALKEVLADPKVVLKIENTKAHRETCALQTFFGMMDEDQLRAYYGYDHVNYANEQRAIDVLMVTDSLFRSDNIERRKQYVGLVERVKENGGEILIFSSLHVSGEQLEKVSGIAAVLRFPLPEPTDFNEDVDSEDEDSEGEEKTLANGI